VYGPPPGARALIETSTAPGDPVKDQTSYGWTSQVSAQVVNLSGFLYISCINTLPFFTLLVPELVAPGRLGLVVIYVHGVYVRHRSFDLVEICPRGGAPIMSRLKRIKKPSLDAAVTVRS